jgi:hypothetical protein
MWVAPGILEVGGARSVVRRQEGQPVAAATIEVPAWHGHNAERA